MVTNHASVVGSSQGNVVIGAGQDVMLTGAQVSESARKAACHRRGFHAQLGMLYASVGKTGQATQAFEAEKALFPESSPYMDFLMKKKSKPL